MTSKLSTPEPESASPQKSSPSCGVSARHNNQSDLSRHGDNALVEEFHDLKNRLVNLSTNKHNKHTGHRFTGFETLTPLTLDDIK